MTLTDQEVNHKLHQWGYLDPNTALHLGRTPSCFPERRESAIHEFQTRWQKYGLKPTGELDDHTINLMKKRFCDCSDAPMGLGEGLRRWNSTYLNWTHNVSYISGHPFPGLQRFVRDETGRVCAMRLTLNRTDRQVNLRSITTFLDGPGGVLGQAWLPGYPSNTLTDTLSQEFDNSETNLTLNMAKILVLHEIWHSLGLGHDESPEIAVMDPYLNAGITEAQPPDIKELINRYGRPDDAPIPEPPPTNPICPPRRLRRLIEGGSELLKLLGEKE